MRIVMADSAHFLSASPSFLQLNKNKPIKESTLKNKMLEWSRKVEEMRTGWEGGHEAFDSCATHAEWVTLIIQVQRAKKNSEVALTFQFLCH